MISFVLKLIISRSPRVPFEHLSQALLISQNAGANMLHLAMSITNIAFNAM